MKLLGKPYLLLVLALVFVWALWSFRLTERLDRAFFDSCSVATANPLAAPANGVMVLIDEDSLKEIGARYSVRWPWPRSLFAALIAALHQAGAEKILMDQAFLEPSDPLHDDVLAAMSAACPETILGRMKTKEPVFWSEEFRRRFPQFAVGQQTGLVDFVPDDDSVYRDYPMADSLAAKAASRAVAEEVVRLRWYGGLKQFPTNRVLSAAPFVILGEKIQTQLRERKIDEADPASVARGLAELPPLDESLAALVRGKTVFVGANAAGTVDLKATPMGKIEPGVLVHFTAWANAEQDSFIKLLPDYLNFLVSVALAFAMILVGWRFLNVTWLVGLGVMLTAGLLAASYFAFKAGTFFPPATAIGGVCFALLASAAHNFWREGERKREIQTIFGSYVSKQVVEQLLKNPEAIRLGGEKKELTVFFSDIVGFTDLAETLPAESLVRLINWYLGELTDFVLDNGGYVDKYIGDAIMGVFGSPEPLANHAESACRAALACRDHMEQMNARAPIEVKVNLRTLLGINTGEMVVGNIGSERKKNFTVLGDAVNLASRLESANREFGTTILLGEDTERQVRGKFVTRPVALVRVKGRVRPNQTYELIGEPEKIGAAEKEFIAAYTAGYEAYMRREFASASEQFRCALALKPTDRMTQLYLDKIAEFAHQAPSPDWDGVLVLKNK